MISVKLEQGLQKLSSTLSEFDDALVDAQTSFVPSPNIADISRRRLLTEIDSNVSNVSVSVADIAEKIEQLKSFEGVL